MNEKHTPADEQVTAPSVEAPSEGYLKLAAELGNVARETKSAAEKMEAALKIQADLQKEREKNRVINRDPAPATYKRDINSILERPDTDFERELAHTWQQAKDAHAFMRAKAVAGKANYNGPQDLAIAKDLNGLWKKANEAWHSEGTAFGEEWAPTLVGSDHIDYFQLPATVASQFPTVQIPKGGQQFDVPISTSATTVSILSAQGTAAGTYSGTEAAPGTAVLSLTPYTHRAGLTISMNMTEDEAVNSMALARMAIQQDLQLAIDEAIINGQDAADANMDGSNGPAAANGIYSGLRKFCHHSPGSNETSNSAAVLESEDVHTIRKSLGKFGVVPTDLRLFVSPRSYINLVGDVTDDNVTTVEKYGNAATIVTGELARVWGIPVIVTQALKENLHTTNGDAATTGAATSALLCNVSRWRFGIKRSIEIRTIPLAYLDQVAIYGFVRHALAGDTNDDNHTWYLYNIG